MPSALTPLVRTGAHDKHCHHGCDVRDRGQEADVQRVIDTRGLDQGGKPEADAIKPHDDAEVHQPQDPYLWIAQRFQERMVGLTAGIGFDLLFEQPLFIITQPACRGDPIVQVKPDHDANQHGRSAFEQKQPLPARPAVDAGKVHHDPAGKRAADDAGNRDGGHEQRNDAAPALGGKPIGQIENHSRKETGFRDAQ